MLVDDETGTITYHPRAVEAATAAAWFDALRDGVAWHAQRRRMYDRDVDVPRLTASFRLDSAELPWAVAAAARRGAELAETPFNSAGLNFYRDGHDSVAPHNDHLYEIVAGYPIGLFSLGAARTMTIRSKRQPRRILDLDLEAGSFLIMSYETQKYYDHGIPKTRKAVGPRVSVALRVRP
ncbi:MAG TPA: alpha-ketoglutarate-dependent dioxygenase AlkB [Verrucomicrobiae bacterium]|nr:alpha-ketoglutarate-dependent dioxygenase AlkB [Verrucomicrobiae bacterium]